MAKSVLTKQADDFPRWYQDVISKAELAENGPARGTMIMKPWGYAIWERIQSELDARIKATGHDNVYFPLLIPMDYFEREASHVEGFSPELAVVTHGGGAELAEPLAVRPTSETVIGDAMSRWIQSHRDLPLLLNQWSNVVRWELRPRMFLRTSEFLWQEGHTAHATWEDALEETLRMHAVYDDLMRNVLGIPTLLGRKTDAERFAGAVYTYTVEGLMRDGKALQMGTSHHLGQNFAKVFGIDYTSESGQLEFCHTTSWGVSTRTVGALIMAHGDDSGLRLPPSVAPAEAVVIAIRPESVDAAEELAQELRERGLRVKVDKDTHASFGRRIVDWELKGVPVRVEIGPRDLAAGVVTFARRDTGEKATIAASGAADAIVDVRDSVQETLFNEALYRRESATTDVERASEIEGSGYFRIPWRALGVEGEEVIARDGYSVRALVTADGGVPGPDDEDLIAYVAKAY